MTDVYAPQSDADTRKFVKSFASDGTAEFDQVNFEDLDFTRIFGQVTTSNTQNAIEYGVKGFTLDYDNNSIQVGYPLQCRSLDDSDCFMQGVVVLKDQTYSPAYIEVAITVISPLVNTTNNWELSVIPLAGFSINPSATVGISTTSIDASGAGPFTFTTQTGKLFMQTEALNGTVICTALNDPKTYLFGRIRANDSTSLVLTKIYSNATASVSAWSIQLFDGPDTGLDLAATEGLLVTFPTSTTIQVTAGSIRDHNDAIDLILPEDITKRIDQTFAEGDGNGSYVLSPFLTGTISSSGTSVTGTGTLFNTELLGAGAVITTSAAVASHVVSVTNDTDLTTASNLSATNLQYKRGGYSATAASSGYSFLCLGRKTSDGTVDVFTSQYPFYLGTVPYVDREVDLPSGYSDFRILGTVTVISGALSLFTYHPDNARAAAPLLISGTTYFPSGYIVSSSTSVARTLTGSNALQFQRAALTGDVTASANANATTIAANAVTNTKLNDMAAYTLKGRNAGTTGDPSDIDITALTEQASPTTTDYLIGVDTAASNAFKKYSAANFSGGDQFPIDMGSITEAATITFDAGTVP